MRTAIECVLVVIITLGLCSRWGEDHSQFARDVRIVGEAAILLGEVIRQGGECLQRSNVSDEYTDEV